jgi:tetratricopeptide (TPR) repeat protein
MKMRMKNNKWSRLQRLRLLSAVGLTCALAFSSGAALAAGGRGGDSRGKQPVVTARPANAAPSRTSSSPPRSVGPSSFKGTAAPPPSATRPSGPRIVDRPQVRPVPARSSAPTIVAPNSVAPRSGSAASAGSAPAPRPSASAAFPSQFKGSPSKPLAPSAGRPASDGRNIAAPPTFNRAPAPAAPPKLAKELGSHPIPNDGSAGSTDRRTPMPGNAKPGLKNPAISDFRVADAYDRRGRGGGVGGVGFIEGDLKSPPRDVRGNSRPITPSTGFPRDAKPTPSDAISSDPSIWKPKADDRRTMAPQPKLTGPGREVRSVPLRDPIAQRAPDARPWRGVSIRESTRIGASHHSFARGLHDPVVYRHRYFRPYPRGYCYDPWSPTGFSFSVWYSHYRPWRYYNYCAPRWNSYWYCGPSWNWSCYDPCYWPCYYPRSSFSFSLGFASASSWCNWYYTRPDCYAGWYGPAYSVSYTYVNTEPYDSASSYSRSQQSYPEYSWLNEPGYFADESYVPSGGSSSSIDQVYAPASAAPAGASGWDLLIAGDVHEARRAFDRAMNALPHDGLPQIGLALANGLLDRDAEAVSTMRQAMREDPEAILEVPRDAALMERIEVLLGRYEDRAKRSVSDIDAQFLIAALRVIKGDYAMAYFAIDKVIERGDSDAAAQNLKRVAQAALEKAPSESVPATPSPADDDVFVPIIPEPLPPTTTPTAPKEVPF